MCVAIYKPDGVILTKRTLKRCFRANPDGAGFAYLDGGRAVIQKGYMHFWDFWRAFRAHADKEAIIHFRLATHGGVTVENCHPFPLPDGGALIHNGILSWCEPELRDERSDTRVFVEDLLSDLLSRGADLFEPTFRQSLEAAIGLSNKMVAFWRGKPVILNEAQGTWQDGAWFSNLAWKWAGLFTTRVHDLVQWVDDPWYRYEYGDDEERPLRRQWEFERMRRCAVCLDFAEQTFRVGVDDVCADCYETVVEWRA